MPKQALESLKKLTKFIFIFHQIVFRSKAMNYVLDGILYVGFQLKFCGF